MGTAKTPERLDYSALGGRQFENVAKSLRSVGDVSITSGRAVEASITTIAQSIQHGLGRALQGWFVMRKDGPGDVYESGSVDESKYVSLKGSAACGVTLWVF